MLLGGGILGDTRIIGRKTVRRCAPTMTPDIEAGSSLDENSDGFGFGLTVAVRNRLALMGSPGVLLEQRLWNL